MNEQNLAEIRRLVDVVASYERAAEGYEDEGDRAIAYAGARDALDRIVAIASRESQALRRRAGQ